MSKNRRGILTTGITSILMVFMILCLVTFSVLALSSAKADMKYSEQTAQRTKAYFDAEFRMNQKLKDIDGELWEQYNNDSEFWEKDRTIVFSEPIDDTAVLEVELRIVDPAETGGKLYRIERWQSLAVEEWNPDMTLPVMQK